MKAAIIGLGVIGKVHLEILIEQQVEIVGLCDIDPNCLAEVKEKYHLQCMTCNDYHQIIRALPDVVHICTPHYLHKKMVVTFLQKNINVLCEKPLAISNDEIREILVAEHNSKAILGVCHQNRFNPINIYVKDFLKDKKITAVFAHMAWKRDQNYFNDSWRGKKNLSGGGVLINQALHTLDLLIWWLSYPQSVKSYLNSNLIVKDIDVEDTAFLRCEGTNNFSFFATNNSFADFQPEIVIKTEHETLTITPDVVMINNTIINAKINGTYYGKPCYGNYHALLIDDFYHSVKAKEKFIISGEEGAKVVRFILDCYQSNAAR